ncbi:MAG TPA: GNAT family N-acetyltransferase [Gemmatimonadales bacterium]|nr:GNAT family N-acetyltransferase [Gemmatimonadales bacterium]
MGELIIRDMDQGEDFTAWFAELVERQDESSGAHLFYHDRYLILTNDIGEWIGGVRFFLRGGVAHLLEFAVEAAHEDVGYGLRLLEAFEHRARDAGAHLAEFWTNDLDSAGIYEELGWREVLRREQYVGRGPWVLLEKRLNPSI